jgi:hypothetical protein
MEDITLNQFEETLLTEGSNNDIKYSIDRDLEGAVRYDFLQETYGKDRVDEVLRDNGKGFLELGDTEYYALILETLSTI